MTTAGSQDFGGVGGTSSGGASGAGGLGGSGATSGSAGSGASAGNAGAGAAAGAGGSAGTAGSASGGSSGANTGGSAGSGCNGPSSTCPNAPPFDFKNVTWLHTNVSSWAETVKLKQVTFTNSQVCMDHDIDGKGWPTTIVNVEVIANPWVFICYENKWYGATWEWLRPGPPVQTCKAKSSVAGDHIKQAPFNKAPFTAPKYWQPTSGETLHFMRARANPTSRSVPIRSKWRGRDWKGQLASERPGPDTCPSCSLRRSRARGWPIAAASGCGGKTERDGTGGTGGSAGDASTQKDSVPEPCLGVPAPDAFPGPCLSAPAPGANPQPCLDFEPDSGSNP